MEIIGIVLVILFIIVLVMYNGLVKLRNNVKRSLGVIDVYLNQRFDLIPNLVETVKGYAKHEQQTLENIIKLRQSYNEKKEVDLEQAKTINKEFSRLLMLAESYPDLKASEQFLNLQKNLVKVESQLQAARRIYNNDVTTYNTKIETVPNNIIALIFGFKKADWFELEEAKRENIKVSLGE